MVTDNQNKYLDRYFSVVNVVGSQKRKSVSLCNQYRILASNVLTNLPDNPTRLECLRKLEESMLYMRAAIERG